MHTERLSVRGGCVFCVMKTEENEKRDGVSSDEAQREREILLV